MGDIFSDLIDKSLGRVYEYSANAIPVGYQSYFVLILMIILIAVYLILIWKFYKFLARRDLLELNLSQYNTSEHPTLSKMYDIGLFALEYIVILPIVVFFWFFIISFLLFFMAKDLPVGTILLISGSIVGAIRITSYYSEDLSIEVAKLFPLTLLAIALVTPGFFNIGDSIMKFGLGTINLAVSTFFYLVIIIALEFVLRMVYIFSGND